MKARAIRTKWAATGATLLAIAALAGCVQDDFGTLGVSGDIYVSDIDPDKLCDWHHHTNYDEGNAFMAVSCKSSRQVYTTCDIWLWPQYGSGPVRVRTHGSQNCRATAQLPYLENAPLPAMGSIGTIWLRLDNPRRRWEFGNWGAAECSVSRNAENQSILECGHVHGHPGNPCPCRALRAQSRAAKQARSLLSSMPPRTAARLTRSCASDARHLRSTTPSSRCATAARHALRELSPDQRRRAFRYLSRSGVDLFG